MALSALCDFRYEGHRSILEDKEKNTEALCLVVCSRAALQSYGRMDSQDDDHRR
jgi:hypothetical protein